MYYCTTQALFILQSFFQTIRVIENEHFRVVESEYFGSLKTNVESAVIAAIFEDIVVFFNSSSPSIILATRTLEIDFLKFSDFYCFAVKIFFLKHVNYSDYNPKVRYLHALKC